MEWEEEDKNTGCCRVRTRDKIACYACMWMFLGCVGMASNVVAFVYAFMGAHHLLAVLPVIAVATALATWRPAMFTTCTLNYVDWLQNRVAKNPNWRLCWPELTTETRKRLKRECDREMEIYHTAWYVCDEQWPEIDRELEWLRTTEDQSLRLVVDWRRYMYDSAVSMKIYVLFDRAKSVVNA